MSSTTASLIPFTIRSVRPLCQHLTSSLQYTMHTRENHPSCLNREACLKKPYCSCPDPKQAKEWPLKLKRSMMNLFCPAIDIMSKKSTLGSTINDNTLEALEFVYIDPSERQPRIEPRGPVHSFDLRRYAKARQTAGDTDWKESASTDSTSEEAVSEEFREQYPYLQQEAWPAYMASNPMLAEEWIRENGIIYDEADFEADPEQDEEGNNEHETAGEEEPAGKDLQEQYVKGARPRAGLSLGKLERDQEVQVHESRDHDELDAPLKGPAPKPTEQHQEPHPEQSSASPSSEEATTRALSSDTGTQQPTTGEAPSDATTNPTTEPTDSSDPKDSKSNASSDDTSRWTVEDHLRLNHVIRRIKKTLDPLNYSPFGFTLADGDKMLDFSNSVRKCIATTGSFGHEVERLDTWLNTMMMEAREGPHRLEFGLIRYAHLDKLLENIVEFKSIPPTLPFQELKMVEMASDLLRYWRHRFGDDYFQLNRMRQKTVMDELLRGLIFETPTEDTPSGWSMIEDRSNLTEAEAEQAFHEGQWWVNMAAAQRDGVVGHQLERPTKGRYGYTAIPLLTGREDNVGPDKVLYVREEKQTRKAPSLGDVPLLSLLGAKVRLLRGMELESPYAPAAGIRYDGLWRVSQYGHRLVEGTTPRKRRLTLTLERYQPEKTMAELMAIPTMATVDFYRLYENIETILHARAATAYAYLDWHARRERTKMAREQWQRLRTFRESVESRRRTEEEARLRPKKTVERLFELMKEGREKLEGKIKERREVKGEDNGKGKENEKTKKDSVSSAIPETPAPVPQQTNIFPGTWEMKTLQNVVNMS